MVLVGNPNKLMSVTNWRPTIDFTTMVHRLLAPEEEMNDNE